ncbi:hypothetical protein AN9484.2 [Aspergillus nidulans FGSC A4]|uniref:Uncharacterized protein n=1 Tax=Emericella nidulans (strain FGSC A4 / ATCC 38163 / CBS 112.46 / NRRL 194 / M139) TaxID=227321 RepID=Q5AQE6_EMENI|nr:hypothetical protein [Aspergillus nidulans FGSC A4]EAA66778.1 hypothetical protein AN9484.2 [Aspergillus nidulans FGSC A4]CBF84373.1 TPA: hypothetical protein ANIA_09484 [Aspergillus nidulans FGSC A4]|eukprot:XP_868866.1 hypothetical protein AN9484.2 [Aspergillus nidulans FGSC A4]
MPRQHSCLKPRLGDIPFQVVTQRPSCRPCTSRRPLSQPEAWVIIRVSLSGSPKAIEQDDDILDSVVERQPEMGGHFVARITDKDNAAKAPIRDDSLIQVRQAGPQHPRPNILDRDLECQRGGFYHCLLWIVLQGNVVHDPTGPAVNAIGTNGKGPVEHAAVGAGHTDYVLGGCDRAQPGESDWVSRLTGNDVGKEENKEQQLLCHPPRIRGLCAPSAFSRIPALYSITAAQTLPPTDENPISGYYISSFLTTTAGNQYYVITAIIGTTELGAYGINILDLNTLQRVVYENTTVYSTTEITSFNFTREDFAFFGADSTNLAIAVRANATASRGDGTTVPVGLELLVHATSRALYYGGTGSWMFIDTPAYSFAFPAAMTSGCLRMSLSDLSMANKEDADAATTLQPIDPSASVSWYDRSWGHLGLPNGNYTWFSLYLDDSELILVTYLIDDSSTSASSSRTHRHTHSRSIHIRPRRNSSALSLEPIDVFEPDLSPDTIWMSPRSGRVYPQQWKLGIEGRGLLSIRSILGDQEMFGRGQGGESYSGLTQSPAEQPAG